LAADTFAQAAKLFAAEAKGWTAKQRAGANAFAEHLITGKSFNSGQLPQDIKNTIWEAVDQACSETGYKRSDSKKKSPRKGKKK